MPDKIYQLKIHLMDVSPMVWRRLLIKDDTTIAQLHGVIQLTMGWENIHLHSFRIYGKAYGVYYSGGPIFSDDPRQVRLKDFKFRPGDKFYYDYNFLINWHHQIRVEKVLDADAKRYYPVCSAGKNACPPEEIQSIAEFTEIRDLYQLPLFNLIPVLEFQKFLSYPWRPDIFRRGQINAWLKTEDWEDLPQNDPHFPDRSRPYFEDDYWKCKDEFETAKRVYFRLQKEGVEAKDGYDALVKFLEPFLESGETTVNPKSTA